MTFVQLWLEWDVMPDQAILHDVNHFDHFETLFVVTTRFLLILWPRIRTMSAIWSHQQLPNKSADSDTFLSLNILHSTGTVEALFFSKPGIASVS